MSPRKKQPATDLPPMDWEKLLVGRETPPKQWWVSEAIERGTSNTELRAQAAMTLLSIPIGFEQEPGSKLVQVPALAKRYAAAFETTEHFAASMLDDQKGLHPDIYRVAVHTFLHIWAACNAVNPPSPNSRSWHGEDLKAADLVPELTQAALNASLVVQDLQERGLDCDLEKGPLLRDLPGHPVRPPKVQKAKKPPAEKSKQAPVTTAKPSKSMLF